MRRILKYIGCFIVMSGMIVLDLVSECPAQENSFGSVKGAEVYAVDFTLKDLNGKDVKFKDYKGKVVLLNFMTTWCPECRASIPVLKTIHARYFEKGLILINVNVQETQETAAAYAKKYGLPYLTILDTEGAISKKYGVTGVPVKALIDRKGRIICWNCRSLEKMLEMQFELPLK